MFLERLRNEHKSKSTQKVEILDFDHISVKFHQENLNH